MMRYFFAVLLALAATAAHAGVAPYEGTTISTATGKATHTLAGSFAVAGTSVTASTPTVTINGASHSITVSTAAAQVFQSQFLGGYSSTEIATLSGIRGQWLFNYTLPAVCIGTGTTASNGAFVVAIATNATTALIPCHP